MTEHVQKLASSHEIESNTIANTDNQPRENSIDSSMKLANKELALELEEKCHELKQAQQSIKRLTEMLEENCNSPFTVLF